MRRLRTTYGLALLLACGSGLCGPGAARGGVIINTTILQPIEDPHYIIDFHLVLTAHSSLEPYFFSTLVGDPPDGISVLNVPGIVSTSDLTLHSEPFAGVRYGFSIDPDMDNPHGFDVSWTFLGAFDSRNHRYDLPLTAGTTDLALGDFRVETQVSLAAPPLGRLIYVGESHDASGNPVSNTGFTDPTIAPEPYTAVGAATGALVGLCAWARRARRRAEPGGAADRQG